MKRWARLSASLLVAGLAGITVGRLLHFTWPQALVLCMSLASLALWLQVRLRPSEIPLIEVPAVSLGLTAVFGLALYAAFVAYPMGATELIGWGTNFKPLPRFLSMIVTSLPAIPYASFGFQRLATG